MSDTLRDRINDAIIPAMIEHGPDGHTDGSEEIAEAVIAALDLRPRYKARADGVYVYWETKAERIEEAADDH